MLQVLFRVEYSLMMLLFLDDDFKVYMVFSQKIVQVNVVAKPVFFS